MNLDKEIYSLLLDHAGGKQKEIKGISLSTAVDMKKGKKKMMFSKVFEVFKDNGITKVTLQSENTVAEYEYKDNFHNFVVTTKSVK